MKKSGGKPQRKKKTTDSSSSESGSDNGRGNESDEETSGEESVVSIDETGRPKGKPSKSKKSKDRLCRTKIPISSATSDRIMMPRIGLLGVPGPAWWGLEELQPTNHLYRRLLSYRTYRL